MEPSERIDWILSHYKIRPIDLAELIGISKDAVYKIQQGSRKSISRDLANRITNKFPEVNRTWLITGIGEPILEEDDPYFNGPAFKRSGPPDMLEVLREQLAEKDKQIDQSHKQIDQLQNTIKEMIDYLKKREEEKRQK